MQINGQTLNAVQTTSFKLPRSDGSGPILKVGPLPIGVDFEFSQIFPLPTPPGRNVASANTGGVPRKEYNMDDPAYKLALEEREILNQVYYFVRTLSRDTNIRFENGIDTADGLRGIKRELDEAGITSGDMNLVINVSLRISNLTEDAMKAAKESFV